MKIFYSVKVKESMYDVLQFDEASSMLEFCQLETEAIETRFIKLVIIIKNTQIIFFVN